MLPQRSTASRVAAALLLLALGGCGIKGPLVPGKTAAPGARPPPEATTAPQIPSATPPVNTQPAP